MWLSIVAVVLAVVLPLGIERFRRPKLICVWAEPQPVNDDWYIHLQVINKPVPFPLGLLLMRNTATTCRARMTFHGTSIKGELATWPEKPDPMTLILMPDTTYAYVFDPTKLEERFKMDLEPNKEGEAIIVAIKGDDEAAFAIGKASYLDAWNQGRRAPQLILLPGEHRLTVDVSAGSAKGHSEFIVRNMGSHRKDLSIEEFTPEHPATHARLTDAVKRRWAARARSG